MGHQIFVAVFMTHLTSKAKLCMHVPKKKRKQKTKLIVIEGRQCRVQRKYMCIIMFNPSVSHNAVGVL